MKRLVLIFAAFALIAVASCSKEQDELSTAYNSDVKAMMAAGNKQLVDPSSYSQSTGYPSVSINQSELRSSAAGYTTTLSLTLENFSSPVTIEGWRGSPRNDDNYVGYIGNDENQRVRLIRDADGYFANDVQVLVADANGALYLATTTIRTVEKCKIMMFLPADYSGR